MHSHHIGILLAALTGVVLIVAPFTVPAMRRRRRDRLTAFVGVDQLSGVMFLRNLVLLLTRMGYAIDAVDDSPSDETGWIVAVRHGGARTLFQTARGHGNLSARTIEAAKRAGSARNCSEIILVTNFSVGDDVAAAARATGLKIWNRSFVANAFVAHRDPNAPLFPAPRSLANDR